MDSTHRMILAEWTTIIGTIFGGIAYLSYQIYSVDNRMEQRMALFEQRMIAQDQRIVAQDQRTDQLYQNFIDLLKEGRK